MQCQVFWSLLFWNVALIHCRGFQDNVVVWEQWEPITHWCSATSWKNKDLNYSTAKA